MAEKDKSESFIKALVELCKTHFNKTPEAPPAPEKKFATAKTKDGSMVMYDGDMPAVGMEIYVMLPDGQQAAAPDGVITMEDGGQIEVLAGKIVAIKPAAATDAPPTGDMGSKDSVTAADVKKIVESTIKEHYYAKDEVDAKVKDLSEKLAASEQAFAAAKSGNETLLKEIAEVKAVNETLTEKFKKHEAFEADVSKLLEEPQAPPATPPAQFNKDKAGDKEPLTREEWQKKYNIK